MDTTISCKHYLFELSYSKRQEEASFVKDIIDKWDDHAMAITLYINNNPYNLQFFIQINLKTEKTIEFDEWIKLYYQNKKMKHNFFIEDFILSIRKNGFSVFQPFYEIVDITLNGIENELFLFPSENVVNQVFSPNIFTENKKIFFCHSSKDKNIVTSIFNELQKESIKVWYDCYEIKIGDSISEKIKEGLSQSALGIVLISNNFLKNQTSWISDEMECLVEKHKQNINTPRLIFLYYDVLLEELPEKFQDIKCINIREGNSYLITEIKSYFQL